MPRSAPDPFALLGLPRDASAGRAEAALAALRPRHHPDAGGDPRRWEEIEAACDSIAGMPGPEGRAAAAAPARAGIDAAANPPPVAGAQTGAGQHPKRKAERIAAWLASPAAAEVTAAGARAEIRRLDGPVVRGRLAACNADRRIGMLILALRGQMEASDLPAHRWYPEVLGIPRKRALRCAKLAGAYDLFLRAHRWFTKEGQQAGWAVSAATGAAYGLEVIDLHRRAGKGEAPAAREDAAEARRERKVPERDADRLAARRDREAQVEEGAPVGRDRSRADLLRALAAERERALEVQDAADRDRREAEWSRAAVDKQAARQARDAVRWRLLAKGWRRRAKAAEAEIARLRSHVTS